MWLLLFGLIVVIVYLVMSLVERPRRETTDERLKRLIAQRKALEGFSTRDLPGAPVDPDVDAVAKAPKVSAKDRLVTLVERATKGRPFTAHMADRLQRADWKWRPAEFLVAQGLTASLALGAGVIFARSLWWLLLVAGWLAPYLLLARAEKARLKTFGQQLPDALAMIANALRSGYSFLQAMDVVSREMPAPICKEFGIVLREARVNIPLEESLTNLVRRVKSPDLDLVVTAVLVQRQVGGNLSEVLDKISGTIRDRIKLHGEIRALTAQGRFSGYVVSLLPLGLGLLMQLMSPGYMKPLFTTPVGYALLGAGAVSQIIGILIIRNMINMEV
ncbi:MAG TPA: type II secretion system F family protein [Symbiobacteriaceae bacterium]|jgi:tight adherence protein B